MEDNSNQNSNPNFLNEDLFNEIKEKLNNPLLIEILKALGISTTTLLANYYFFSKPTNERIDYLEKKVSKKNKSLKKQSVQIEQLKSN